jgi:hypothetical protein
MLLITCSAVEKALFFTVSPVLFASFAPCFSASVATDEASGFELAYDTSNILYHIFKSIKCKHNI